MVSKHFPQLAYKDIAKLAAGQGFYCARKARGSHEIWRNDATGGQTTIPNHGSQPLKRKTVRAILEDLGLSLEDVSQHE